MWLPVGCSYSPVPRLQQWLHQTGDKVRAWVSTLKWMLLLIITTISKLVSVIAASQKDNRYNVNLEIKHLLERRTCLPTCCIIGCDQVAQLYEWFSPSVCQSVCLSHLFDYVPIIESSWNVQELLPMTKVTSMPKVKVRGQIHVVCQLPAQLPATQLYQPWYKRIKPQLTNVSLLPRSLHISERSGDCKPISRGNGISMHDDE